MQKRLFIVSNRMPVSIEASEKNISLRKSSGGLVSAIDAYLKKDTESSFVKTFWAGVPDCDEATWQRSLQSNAPNTGYEFLPVFVPEHLYEGYYNGFSNSLLWPLFHYFPSFVDYHTRYFNAYMEVNEQFCETLVKTLKKDDVVWIHDYHLLPLAAKLRRKIPGLTIGLFLHIPFPSYELLRVIPRNWQREILLGMLGADLIGFHTIDYAQHFLHSVEKVLRISSENQTLSSDNRQIKVNAFPISIDYEQFHHAVNKPEVQTFMKEYNDLKAGKKMIFSVDRLDYTKGISNRLKGFKRFLQDNPEYQNKVVFTLVVVPSRDLITKYAERKKMIDEYIGNLNSSIGNIGWQPVIYQYGHLSFDELIALYNTCDLALITPLRDGMNLVSKEFVASRSDGKGVLVLSEMTGAAVELTEALIINPNDTKEIASMIKTGLEMPIEEQTERMQAMQCHIKGYDIVAWAADFLNELDHTKTNQLEFETRFVDAGARVELINNYSTSKRGLFLLDYDGTLTSFAKHPSEAIPGENVLNLLNRLSSDPLNDVYVISGRDSSTLESWLGHLPIGLVSEHGRAMRNSNKIWETNSMEDTGEWLKKIESLMNECSQKCAGSFVEKKDHSIAWHYRNAEIQTAAAKTKELYEQLQNKIHHCNLPLNIILGNKVVEVRINGIDKGIATDRIMNGNEYDFIFSAGDDVTDEDMFKKLAKIPHAFTIKVGPDKSFAKYNLMNSNMVLSLLETMSSCKKVKNIQSKT